MKKFLKVLGIIVVVIGLIIAAVFYFTAGMVEVGDEFFEAASKGDSQRAYEQLAQEFASDITPEELQAFLDNMQVADLESVDWGERSFSGSQGEIAGMLKLKGGGSVPFSMDMLKEDDGWKVYTIRKTPSGIQSTPASREIPAEAEIIRLVNETTAAFTQSVYEKSMAKFYDHISVLWQNQTTVEELDGIFGGLYPIEDDMRVLLNYSPVFTSPPSINANGVLLVEGHYPTKPTQVNFTQKYIFEGVGWKVVGYSSNLVEVGGGE